MSNLEGGTESPDELPPAAASSSHGFSFSLSDRGINVSSMPLSFQNLSALASADLDFMQIANDLRMNNSLASRSRDPDHHASETESLLPNRQPAVVGPPIPADTSNGDRESNTTGNTVGGIPIPNSPDEMRESLFREFNQVHHSVKLWVPFVLLLVIKFLLDHFVRCSLVISILYSTTKIKSATEMQMSLKSRSSSRTILALFAFNTFLIVSMLFFLQLLGYSENLLMHLTLTLDKLQSNSFWQVLWNCFLMDTFLQMVGQELKTFICLLGTVRHPYAIAIFKYLFPNLATDASANRGTPVGARTAPVVTGRDHRDIEGGFSPSSRAPSALLVRRGNGESNNEHNHSLQSIEPGVALEGSFGDSSDSSEAADSWDYLLKLKFCKLVDVIIYLYRTIVPAPIWIAYFNDEGYIITTAYIVLKVLDGTWKMRAGMDTILQMVHKKLVSM